MITVNVTGEIGSRAGRKLLREPVEPGGRNHRRWPGLGTIVDDDLQTYRIHQIQWQRCVLAGSWRTRIRNDATIVGGVEVCVQKSWRRVTAVDQGCGHRWIAG
ncbi:MAG: hypothetical protein IPP28_00270 [Xanthomonadales bacterium]|nr:hypothetical protein [Xanthomonadales bacterium]